MREHEDAAESRRRHELLVAQNVLHVAIPLRDPPTLSWTDNHDAGAKEDSLRASTSHTEILRELGGSIAKQTRRD